MDPYSSQIIAGFSTNIIKADFGSGLWDGAPIGIPYAVVCGGQPRVAVNFRANGYDGNYGDESDPDHTGTTFGAGRRQRPGDSHVLVVDKDNKMLYELYNASLAGDHWEASSGAVFDLKSNSLRPDGWTSADAAGLPIFPGLVRYEEILKGVIDHPIRFLPSSRVKPGYVLPARHKVNSSGGATTSLPLEPGSALKAGFDISGYSPVNRIIRPL